MSRIARTFYIDKQLDEFIDKQAELESIKRSDLVNALIIQGVKTYKPFSAGIDEALAANPLFKQKPLAVEKPKVTTEGPKHRQTVLEPNNGKYYTYRIDEIKNNQDFEDELLERGYNLNGSPIKPPKSKPTGVFAQVPRLSETLLINAEKKPIMFLAKSLANIFIDEHMGEMDPETKSAMSDFMVANDGKFYSADEIVAAFNKSVE